LPPLPFQAFPTTDKGNLMSLPDATTCPAAGPFFVCRPWSCLSNSTFVVKIFAQPGLGGAVLETLFFPTLFFPFFRSSFFFFGLPLVSQALFCTRGVTDCTVVVVLLFRVLSSSTPLGFVIICDGPLTWPGFFQWYFFFDPVTPR